MAVLALVDDHKNDLKFLRGQPNQISADFCKLAWNFLTKGANMKLYQTASQKLQVDIKQIQAGVEGLANLFIEAQKYELSEKDFRETVRHLGFSDDLCKVIHREYVSQKNMLQLSLPQAGMQHLQFKNLEWRFEAEVSSKTVKKHVQPRVLIKLDLEKRGKRESICLQSDIPNMIHINQIISQALQESRTQHSKRIQRAILHFEDRRPNYKISS